MHKTAKQLNQDERGFASIVVALVLIMVLSLITIGFAQLARREQQNALTKQLSSQAYYAAEAGINDAYTAALQHGGLYDQERASPGNTIDPHVCLNTFNGGVFWKNYDTGADILSDIDVRTGTSYSCVMVNLRPTTLSYTGVSPGAYRDVVFSATDVDTGAVTDAKTLHISWDSYNGNTGLQTGGFKPTGNGGGQWGDSLGVIQFSVTPLPGNFSRDYLMNNSFTVYLYPQNGGGTVQYNVTPEGNAPVLNAVCNNGRCDATIEDVPAAPNYQIHFLNYYDSSNVRINARDSSGKLVGFQGGQIVIDATGRARDTMKRLQIHVPLTVDGKKPSEAMEGQSVCKRIAVYPGNPQADTETPSTYSGSQSPCNYWNQPN